MYYNFDPNNDYSFDEKRTAPQQSEPVNGEYHYAAQPAAVEPEQPARSRTKKRGLGLKIVAVAVVCALLGGISGAAMVGYLNKDTDTAAAPAAVAAVADEEEAQPVTIGNTAVSPKISSPAASGDNYTAEEVYANVVNSVVGITSEIVGTNVWGQSTSSAASGTGFIITADGYILTNNHVIEDSSTQTVMLYNGDTYDAKIVAADETNDVAVLKIEATGLIPVSIGDSDKLKVGQSIYVIGNPLGELTYSLTAGIVSALDRAINTDGTPVNMFQIDAAVNSGNSGGPVLNSAGEVVGIVTAKYSSTGVEGLGFALPINDVVKISNDLLEYGYVKGRPYFGITVITVSESAAQYYDMVTGAYVKAVDEGSCAGKAGIQAGDIITAIDGEEVLSSSDVVSLKALHQAGDVLKLTVWRDGETLELTVTLDEEPAPSDEPEEETTTQEQSEQYQQSPYGGYYYYYGNSNPFGFSFGN